MENKEALELLLCRMRKDYPVTLRVKDLEKILGCYNSQVYNIVQKIPGAKKIKTLGWRIPRDTFFAWYYFNKGEKGYEDEKARL